MKDQYRPTVPDVLPLVHAYIAARPENAAGGRLHIILDDGNVGERDVQLCLERCIEEKDVDGEKIARLLLQMTKTQRGKIANNTYRKETA